MAYRATLEELLSRALPVLREKYPDNDIDFWSAKWDVNGPHRPRIKSINWPDDGLNQRSSLLVAAKIWWLLSGTTPSNAGNLIGALPTFIEVLGERVGLTLEDGVDQVALNEVEPRMEGANSTIYVRARAFKGFIAWIKAEGLVDPHLVVTVSTRRDDRGGIHRKENLEKKLPTLEVISALGELYRKSSEPADILRISLVAIMLVTGLRSDELNTLEEDGLEMVLDDGGRERWRVRYHNLKSERGSPDEYGQRWLSDLGSVLVRDAWKKIREITRPWRRYAELVGRYTSEGRYPIEELFDEEFVLASDVWPLLGLNSRRSKNHYIKEHWPDLERFDATEVIPGFEKPKGSRKKYNALRREDLRRHLEEIITYTHVEAPDGEMIPMHEALAIVPPHFLMGWDGRVLSPEPIPKSWAVTFLSAPRSSAFQRFGLLDAHGDPLSMNPHSLRHFVNTMANKAGMTAFQITIWMGRSDHFQTQAYLHDPEEYAEYERFSLMEQNRSGKIQERLNELPPERRATAVQDVRNVHGAGYVGCALNFSQRDCPKGGWCTECSESLHSNDPKAKRQRAAQIEELESNIEVLKVLPQTAPTARSLEVAESELAALRKVESDFVEGVA